MSSPIGKRSKPVACERCQSRKVKCSGTQPCMNCRGTSPAAECLYPARDRQLKISQKYSAPTSESTVPNEVHDPTDASQVLQNPLFKERPWFHNVSSLDMPIHIGEATDAAFATRFRQTLGTVCTSHLLRTSYSADAPSLTLTESQYRWPSPARARFLVKVAFSTVCRYYHMVRKSAIRESLETAIKNEGSGDRIAISKLLALFALGRGLLG